MNASELKYHIEQANEESYFFARKTMRFFGDTMKNYGVRKITIKSQFDAAGVYHKEGVARIVLELYRKRAVKHGNKGSAYFDAETFKRVHCVI